MLASALQSNLRLLAASLESLARLEEVRPISQTLGHSSDEVVAGTAMASLLQSLVKNYGDNSALLTQKVGRLIDHCEAFIQRFGDGPVRVLRAPARINILGEHVDYASYIPTASLTFGSREHDMVMMLRPNARGLVRGASTDARFETFEFEVGNGPAHTKPDLIASEWLSYLYSRPAPPANWANYTEGACRFAQMKYGTRISTGFDFVIDSSVPAGAGASSSSALCVLSGSAVRIVNGIAYERPELAIDSSQAEWYVGTRGGSMDHTTILLARPESAINISYATGSLTLVALPASGYLWITFFAHPANKGQEVMNQYNDRAMISRIVIPAILKDWQATRPDLSGEFFDGKRQFESGSVDGIELMENALGNLPEFLGIGQLCEDYPAAFEECSRAFPSFIASPRADGFIVRKRALHHGGEVRRVARAVDILMAARGREGEEPLLDAAMTELGSLLGESHSSLRDLYEVSTEEVDELVGIINASGLACGARMMGGGFGGNVLALVPAADRPALIEQVQQQYYSPRSRDGLNERSIMVSTPGLGVSEIE